MTSAQKKFLAKLVDLNVDSFRITRDCIYTYDTERKGWYPKLLFGRGERVAFRSLVKMNAVVPYRPCGYTTGATDGYTVNVNEEQS